MWDKLDGIGMKYLQSIFFAIDNNSSDLLVEEEQNGGQHCRKHRSWNDPPRIIRMEGVDDPSAPSPRRFELFGNLRCPAQFKLVVSIF